MDPLIFCTTAHSRNDFIVRKQFGHTTRKVGEVLEYSNALLVPVVPRYTVHDFGCGAAQRPKFTSNYGNLSPQRWQRQRGRECGCTCLSDGSSSTSSEPWESKLVGSGSCEASVSGSKLGQFGMGNESKGKRRRRRNGRAGTRGVLRVPRITQQLLKVCRVPNKRLVTKTGDASDQPQRQAVGTAVIPAPIDFCVASSTHNGDFPVIAGQLQKGDLVKNLEQLKSSWLLNDSNLAVRNQNAEKYGSAVSFFRDRGWQPSHCPFRTMFVKRRGKQVNWFQRFSTEDVSGIPSQRSVLAAAHAARSVSECEIEEDERSTFTSIAAGDSGEVSMRRKNRVSPGHGEGRWRPATDALAGTPRETSERLRGKFVKKKSPNADDRTVAVMEVDDGSGAQSQNKKLQDVEADTNVGHASEENGRLPSDRLVGKTKASLLPWKQRRIGTVVVEGQPDGSVSEVMEILTNVSTSKGVARVLGRFAGKFTIQDLKQLLMELGTGLERNWAKALQVFDWMHDMAVYDIDAAMYHSMLVLLGKAKKMDVAESLIERMKKDGLKLDDYIYTALVSGYVRSGNLQKAIDIIEQMKSPSVSVYNVLIDGCLKVPKGFEIARNLLKKIKEDGLSPDRITYTTMIMVYSRKGHHSEAIRMFQEMQLEQCHPDVLTFNAVINAYAKLGDIQGMLQAHRSMAELQVDPDTITFNILLSALGRAGRTKDVCRMYRLMRKIRVTPDVATCSILVNIYGRVRAWDDLDLLIDEMESLGLQPDLAVYNSLISIYGKASRFQQVEQIVLSLQNSPGIVFDVITYNTLIDVYGRAGRLSDVIKWFSEMKKQAVKPDVRTFNALVHAYGRASEYDGVKEVLQLFQADGSKPDLVFYHTLLFMFAKGAKYNDAWGVIQDMKKEGYTLTLDIYNSLVLVFGRSNAQEAVKLYLDMISSDVQPNATTFKLLIEVHARKGLVDDCLKIYRISRDILGNGFNDSVLSSVFGACCNMRRTEEAEKLLLELEHKQQSLPSVACFNWLILGYGRQGLWAEAELVLQRMRTNGLVPNGQSYSFLMDAYSMCGLYAKAEKLRIVMLEANLMNTISSHNSLLRYHVRSGRIDLALQTLDELDDHGVKANHNTYTAILSAFGEDESLNKNILSQITDLEKLQLEAKHGIYSALLAAIPKCKSHREARYFLGALSRLGCPSEICCILKDVGDEMEEDNMWTNLVQRLHSIDKNGFNLETQRSLQNALIDALWWFGWERRALQVVRISLDLGIFGKVYKWSKLEWTVNLAGGSAGTVQILLLMWISSMRDLTARGEEPPPRIKIILAEEWQLRLGENKAAMDAVKAHLEDLGAVYSVAETQLTLEMSGTELLLWLRQEHLEEKLFLVESLR